MAHYHPYAFAAQQHHHRCVSAAAAQHQQHHHLHHLPPFTTPTTTTTTPSSSTTSLAPPPLHHHHLPHNLPLRHHHHHHQQHQQLYRPSPSPPPPLLHHHHHNGTSSQQLLPTSVLLHPPSTVLPELSPITLPSIMISPSPPPSTPTRPTTPTSLLPAPTLPNNTTTTMITLPPLSSPTNIQPPPPPPPSSSQANSGGTIIQPGLMRTRIGDDDRLLTRSNSSPSRLLALDLSTPTASSFSQLHSASAQAATAAAAVAAASAQAAANSVAMFHEQVRQLHSHSHFRNLEEAHEQLVRDMILTNFVHTSSVPTIMHHHFHHHHHHHMPLLDANEDHDSPLVSSMTMFQAPAPLDLQYETLSQLEPVPRGASTEAIEKLPTSTFSTSQVANSDDEAIITRCNICLDDYCDGDQLKTLAMCKHNFHSDCIIKWLAINKTCPVCRAEVTVSNTSTTQQSPSMISSR